MKAILISIKPKYVADILNGEKTIEIRKKFPKDYVDWVYIYATKDRRYFLDQVDEPNDNSWFCWDYTEGIFVGKKKNGELGKLTPDEVDSFNGKVVARFWCDSVDEIKYHFGYYDMGEWTESYILENSCLTAEELDNYLQASKEHDEKKVGRVYGKAIHITKLEIFDKPKELKEFFVYSHSVAGVGLDGKDKTFEILKPLTKAPQSYCYIKDVL